VTLGNDNGTDGQTDGQTECDAICGPSYGGEPHNKPSGRLPLLSALHSRRVSPPIGRYQIILRGGS